MRIMEEKALLVLFAATAAGSILSGCLCPACIQNPPGGAKSADTTAAASPSSDDTQAEASGGGGAEAASGENQVIWDGENASAGQSWASCDQEGKCEATFAIADGEGTGGGIGLKLHGKGSGWQGGGWNWHGWWPENAGTDLSPFDDLKFKVKITGEGGNKVPDAGGINIAFGCSFEKKNSADASLGKYAANAHDGKWHEVTIPLKDFFDGKGKECDPRTAWEIRFGAWSPNEVNFNLVVDDIVAVKR